MFPPVSKTTYFATLSFTNHVKHLNYNPYAKNEKTGGYFVWCCSRKNLKYITFIESFFE